MVGAGDDEVDGLVIKEVVEAKLDAAGGGAVGDDYPFVFVLGLVVLEIGRPRAVIAKGGWRDIGGVQGGFDEMGLADPGTGGGGDGDGDAMAGGLEGVDEGQDVGGEAEGWGAIIIDHLVLC